MANYKIEHIEGIGPAKGEKLRAIGVRNIRSLLANTVTAEQRRTLAEKTGIGEAQILKFANMADLCRVKGIGAQFAELLEAAGVDTIPELAKRNAVNLAKAMLEINQARSLVRRTPTERQVTSWIEQANTLPRMLKY